MKLAQRGEEVGVLPLAGDTADEGEFDSGGLNGVAKRVPIASSLFGEGGIRAVNGGMVHQDAGAVEPAQSHDDALLGPLARFILRNDVGNSGALDGLAEGAEEFDGVRSEGAIQFHDDVA